MGTTEAREELETRARHAKDLAVKHPDSPFAVKGARAYGFALAFDDLTKTKRGTGGPRTAGRMCCSTRLGCVIRTLRILMPLISARPATRSNEPSFQISRPPGGLRHLCPLRPLDQEAT